MVIVTYKAIVWKHELLSHVQGFATPYTLAYLAPLSTEFSSPIIRKDTDAGKSQLIGKDPDAGKDWGQEDEGVTEDEMVGWHHRLNDTSLSKFCEMVKVREAWRALIHGDTNSQIKFSDWTTTTKAIVTYKSSVCRKFYAFIIF